MHPTIALMLSQSMEDERRRELGRRRLLQKRAAVEQQGQPRMSLVDMFRARNRGLASAKG